MFLSGAMMLDWLAVEKNRPALAEAANHLTRSVERAFSSGDLVSTERGGDAGVVEISERVRAELLRET